MLFFAQGLQGTDFVIASISFILVIVLSLSLHEFAHAFAAYKCGDTTPKIQGRVTLNPFNHIEPVGFVCCALFGFGWAKPVQINPANFRNIKKGSAWTSIAGVLMNLLLGFLGYGLYCLVCLSTADTLFVTLILNFCYYLFFINICLAVFNILPIYPLDGFRFVETLTKYNNGYVNFMHKYGNIILIIFIVFFDSLLITLINYICTPIILFWNLIF
ncbi:MAG: site-2 protease family protein [Clostridiales bacterium]|nr:site-2 protease family protein [Clostridiales bacterium]